MRFDCAVQCLHVIDKVDFLHEFLITNDTAKLPIIFMDLRVHGETAAVFQSETENEIRSLKHGPGHRTEIWTYIFPQSAHCHFCCSFFF